MSEIRFISKQAPRNSKEAGFVMGKVRESTKKGSKSPSSGRKPAFVPVPSRSQQSEVGRSLRATCPRGSHAAWRPSDDRPDPVSLLKESSTGRIPELIPVRYGRMLQSPFAFYRGAALNMAADLAGTPTNGLRVQACGDCHLLNFGAFATPERRVVFDINDFDETLPAPWEWDVKRLAASFVLACRRQRLRRGPRPGRGPGVRPILSRAHGGVQPDADPRRLVCQDRNGGGHPADQG